MQSKAHIKASAKYNASNYKTFTVNVKIADYEIIDRYCKDNNISKAQLIIKSVLYVINNKINV